SHKFGLGLALAVEPQIPCCDANHGAFAIGQNLGCGEAWVDFYPKFFGLAGKPADDIAEANDITAMVRHQRRHDEIRKRHVALRAKISKAVLRHMLRDGRAFLPPSGNESVETGRVEDSAREDVRACFGALLEKDNRDILASFGCELFQADRC